MRYLVAFIARLMPVGLFLVLVAFELAVSYRRAERHRQALVVPLVSLFALFVLLDTDWVEALSRLALAHVMLRWNTPIASNPTLSLSLALNCTYISLVVLLKLAYRFVVHLAYDQVGPAIEALAGRFYGYDEREGRWLLQDRWRGLRQIVRNLFVCTCALSGLAIFLMNAPHAISGAWGAFMPCIGVTIMAEVYSALNGQTRRERRDSLESDPEHALRRYSYSKIVNALRYHFPGKMLAVRSSGAARQSDISHDDFCEELISSPDRAHRLAGTYFRTLIRQGILGGGGAGAFPELNRDAALACVSLLAGNSVLFCEPFFHDLIPYVFLPVHACLIRGQRVVFVHASGEVGHDIREFVEGGLTFASGVGGLWSVGELRPDGSASPDVAMLTFDDLADLRLLHANAAYFRDTSFVGVFDASALLSAYQIPLAIFADLVNPDDRATFSFFDINRDGLVDALSHTFLTHLVEVAATEPGQGSHIGVFWDVDDMEYQHRLFPDIAHYLGVGPEIGLVALKSQASRVTWVSREAVPMADQRWVLGQYAGELFDFCELPQQQAQLDERFEFVVDPWAMRKEQERFIMVEDEDRNLFEAYRQFATRGTGEAFVNVLSPDYLLRAYMTDNASLFEHDPKAIPSLVPDAPRSERNLLLEFVSKMMASKEGVTLHDDEVIRKLRRLGVRETDARAALGRLMRTYLAPNAFDDGHDEAPESLLTATPETSYDPIADREEERVRFGLLDRARFASCFRDVLSVPLVTEMPDGTMVVLGTRVFGLVWQCLLPGQFTVVDGKYYEVVSISYPEGVVLRRAGDHFSRRRYYRQVREYDIVDEDVGLIPEQRGIAVSRLRLNVTVRTSGYLELGRYSDLGGARRKAAVVPTRRYVGKDVLRIYLPGASPEVIRTLCVVMAETFVTLFPRDHHYLAVLSAQVNDLPDGLAHHTGPQSKLAAGCVYVVEDSPQDMGLIAAVERNAFRILSICCEFLLWHEDALLETAVVPRAPQARRDDGASEDPKPEEETDGQDEAAPARPTIVERIRALLRRLLARIRSMLGK